jgi:hypothetical protein
MYLLDANVFITAKNAHYGMDFAPGFWSWLASGHGSGRIFTIDAVKTELRAGGDDLGEWAAAQPSSFYRKPDGRSVQHLEKLASWVNNHDQYTAAARATFLGGADYYLVAQARSLEFTVVTHELPAPAAKKNVKIPDACKFLGVPHVLPWKMLRDESVRLVV